MATSKNLLSIKGQEPRPVLKGVEKAKDAGGPTPFDTSVYAGYKFSDVSGLSQDRSAASSAHAPTKAQPVDKLKGAEGTEDAETDHTKKAAPNVGKHANAATLKTTVVKESEDVDDEPVLDEEKDEEEAETPEPDASESEDEDDAEVEIPSDEEADETPVAAPDEAEEEDDEELLASLSELVDDDEQVIDLGAEEGAPMGDEEVVEADQMPMDTDEPVVEGDDETLFPTIEVEAAGEEVPMDPVAPEMEDPAMVEAEGAVCEKCGRSTEVTEAADEEEDLVEGKLNIKFQLDENDLLMESNSNITSEEKRQARSLFESAVLTVAADVSKTLQKAYAKKHRQRLAEAREVARRAEEAQTQQLDRYMSYVVEQWLVANKVPLRTRLQAKLTENFMRGLKNVFKQNFIDVPESKVDVVEALSRQNKTLRGQLKESETKNLQLNEEFTTARNRDRQTLKTEHKLRLVAEAANRVTPSKRGDFTKRASALKWTGTKNFKSDLKALTESYSGASRSADKTPSPHAPSATPLFESRTPVSTPVIDPLVQAALQASKRMGQQ